MDFLGIAAEGAGGALDKWPESHLEALFPERSGAMLHKCDEDDDDKQDFKQAKT